MCVNINMCAYNNVYIHMYICMYEGTLDQSPSLRETQHAVAQSPTL